MALDQGWMDALPDNKNVLIAAISLLGALLLLRLTGWLPMGQLWMDFALWAACILLSFLLLILI
jgi:hypothetical protein